MKKSVTAAVLLSAFIAGCVPMQPNPEFNNCSNACNKKQDACMVRAGTAEDVDHCNTTLNACFSVCEKRYPRYLEPK